MNYTNLCVYVLVYIIYKIHATVCTFPQTAQNLLHTYMYEYKFYH